MSLCRNSLKRSVCISASTESRVRGVCGEETGWTDGVEGSAEGCDFVRKRCLRIESEPEPTPDSGKAAEVNGDLDDELPF